MSGGERPVIPRGRVLGLDLGSRRIGVAVSDSGRTVATGVTVVERVGDRTREHESIARLVAEYEAVEVVVGVPYSLSGDVGPAARAALEEMESLRAVLSVPVEAADERLSTVAAAGALRASGRGVRKARSVIDQTAAAFILQGWIDRRPAGGVPG
jgi:putative Holliday junction resolvase